MTTSNGNAEAGAASVSVMDSDETARRNLLDMAQSMPEGEERNRILEIAESLTTPRQRLAILADEAESAAEDIKAKMAGMEETRRTKLAEAKDYRAQAKKLES